jgi:glycosyltransferase involved in cell wall biosynthesis
MENTNNIVFPYKLCIPYKNKAKGGMYTFFTYLKDYLSRNNIEYTENLSSHFDVLILNSFMSKFWMIFLRKFIQPKLKIVHRIDGAAEDYGRGKEWDEIQKKINRLANLTIFQSQYSRFATTKKFNVIFNDGPIIHNPIDTNIFKPNQKKMIPVKPLIAYVTFSTNQKKGIREFLSIAQKNPDLHFIMIGNCPDELKKEAKNVEFTGLLTRVELAEKLSECHYFLFFSKNEACPNVVLEAMASGLVVLFIDSGASSELVGATGFPITESNFRSIFDSSLPQWSDLSYQSRKRAEDHFSLDRVFSQYLHHIKSIIQGQK